jgi:hypothetical protein
MPYFDRYDIVEAHYAFATDWHGGQASELYRKQCRISRYFNPGYHWDGYESLSDNGKAIYDELCERNGFAE